ncbi:MAG: tRNA dihydrouridine synthase DusB [Alphaproteobacteria bacterium]|nr:tRNA dihydrouridine synthase DusB [Alphaproteobacteria bacterium]
MTQLTETVGMDIEETSLQTDKVLTERRALTVRPLKRSFVCGAPMAGVTDKPFRMICRKFGNETLFTEMIGVNSLYRRSVSTCRMMRIADEQNIVVQLVGIDETALVYAAKEAVFNGAIGVDINMGCPVKKLITNGSGASLMKNADIAVRLVSAVKRAVDIPVTVKTRLGWDEKQKNVVSFAKQLVDAGVDGITIHARTKEQGYSGQADWQNLQTVKQVVNIPVFVNGDITDKHSLKMALDISQADGAMIGRGMLGRPWVLHQLADVSTQLNITGKVLADLICEHLAMMLSYYGKAGLFAMRKHLAWYAKGYIGHAEFCRQMFCMNDEKKVYHLVEDFFDNAEKQGE